MDTIESLLPIIAKILNDAGIKAIPYDTGGGNLVVAIYKNKLSAEHEYDAAIGPEGLSVYEDGEYLYSVKLNENPDYVAEVNKVFSTIKKDNSAENYAKNKLQAKVEAVNRANAEALRLDPILRSAIEPFVGQKVYLGSGELTSKLKKAMKVIDPLLPDYRSGTMVYRFFSNYNIIYIVKTAQKVDERQCLYHEVSLYLGEIENGILKKVVDKNLELRSDYTVSEIEEKLAAQKAAFDALAVATSDLGEFSKEF